MFEIPDDDDDFWNDEPLEDKFLSKPGSISNKENRSQLRVPDSTCTGNPAKRLCTGFSRDVTLPVQTKVDKELTQCTRAVNANNLSESVLVHKSIPNRSDDITVAGSSTQNLPSELNNPTVNSDRTNGSVQSCKNTEAFIDAPFHIPFPNEISTCSHADSIKQPAISNTCMAAKDVNVSVISPTEINKNDSRICIDMDKGKILEKNTLTSNTNKTLLNKELQRNQSEASNVSACMSTRRRSRSNENETGDHVTPQRKRKFPGPAGILPKLGPGRNLEMMSPAAIVMTTPAADKSPKDDGIILCSQQTDDMFSDIPWQSLLTDLGDDGQKLLKKYSISSTLLKSGKKQLIQGKAALIFGIIESIESHGSEASVTIRDRSGRMQGTIHHDLLKDHEADLQAGTVLVLKQVSIISLSNRNHYLNITPSNVVVLYRGGEGSLRSLKFHGSEDSLQSVLSALERKAATQHSSLNTSLNVTPSSHTGSKRFGTDLGTPQQFGASPISGLGTDTPLRYGTSPITPITNQRLFSPQTPLTGQSINVRTPTLSGVRNVSVVDTGMGQMHNRQNNFTCSFENTDLQSRLSTSVSHLCSNTSLPNTDLTAINNGGKSKIGQGQVNNNVPNASVKILPSHNASANTVLNTPNVVGKSKWKFKSPPCRKSSLPSSPDIGIISGNTTITAVNSRITTVNSINTNLMSNDTAVRSVEVRDDIKHQTISIKTTVEGSISASIGGSTSAISGSASAWSFKTSNILHTDNGKENSPGQTYRPVTNASEKNLWEDDLDDDILSQLSEEFT